MVVVKPRALAAIAAATSLAFLFTASPAVAGPTEQVILESAVTGPGEIVARGAAVDLPLEIRCNTSEYLDMYVSVTERSGRRIASGYSAVRSSKVVCDGSTQSLEVRVKAQDAPFRRGTAIVSLYMSGCLQSSDGTGNWICGEEASDLEVSFER